MDELECFETTDKYFYVDNEGFTRCLLSNEEIKQLRAGKKLLNKYDVVCPKCLSKDIQSRGNKYKCKKCNKHFKK